MENLISNGKLGGVMLVFVEGFSEAEINNKVKAITEFCKTIKDIPEDELATKLGGKHTKEQKEKISKSIKEHWEKRKAQVAQ